MSGRTDDEKDGKKETCEEDNCGTENKENEEKPEEKKSIRSRIADFFRTRSLLLVSLGAVLIVVITLVLAVVLGGDVYDKAATLWAAAFAAEFFYCLRVNRSRASIALTVISGLIAVAFTVLYALELTEIIP